MILKPVRCYPAGLAGVALIAATMGFALPAGAQTVAQKVAQAVAAANAAKRDASSSELDGTMGRSIREGRQCTARIYDRHSSGKRRRSGTSSFAAVGADETRSDRL